MRTPVVSVGEVCKPLQHIAVASFVTLRHATPSRKEMVVVTQQPAIRQDV